MNVFVLFLEELELSLLEILQLSDLASSLGLGLLVVHLSEVGTMSEVGLLVVYLSEVGTI